MSLNIRSKLLITFGVVVVISVVLTAYFSRYVQKKFVIERAKVIASNEVSYLATEIKDIFKLALSDLMILRELPELQKFAENGDFRNKKSIQQVFYSFALHHKIYYQLRLLNSLGKEIVRVNYNKEPVVVPDKQLQVKYQRYYFQQMLKLKKGEVYISPFDLNIEHHKIEFPYKPVIRIGIPVYDKNGNSFFFLILNLNGQIILNLFENRENKKLGEFILVDELGNFLYHPEKRKRFCFMLGNKDNIFKCMPVLKSILRENSEKVVYLEQGLKNFSIIALKKFKPVEQRNSPYFTVLYSISDPDLLVGFNKYVKSFVVFIFLILIVCLLLASFIAYTISKPVLSLVGTTKKIEQGDFSARVDFKSNDELGVLAENFNNMANKLEMTFVQLKESNEKYRNLFENSQDTVFLMDIKGEVMELNSAGYKLFEFEKEGVPFNLFHYTEDFTEELKKNGEVEDKEIIINTSSGKKVYCSLKAKITEKELVQGIIRDVTELKKRHEERIKAKRLMEEKIILAEESERRKIGQLIHEQLAQDIAFLHLKAQGLNETFQNEQLNQIVSTTEKMLKQIRGTIFDLCPVILDEHGLISAIKCFADNFQDKTGISTTFYSNLQEEKIPFNQSQKFYFFRITKELLNNIFKHAHAEEVVISLLFIENKIKLIVDDDGVGFETDKILSTENITDSIGLFTIKKWVEHFNGKLFIESEINKGTRVILEMSAV